MTLFHYSHLLFFDGLSEWDVRHVEAREHHYDDLVGQRGEAHVVLHGHDEEEERGAVVLCHEEACSKLDGLCPADVGGVLG